MHSLNWRQRTTVTVSIYVNLFDSCNDVLDKSGKASLSVRYINFIRRSHKLENTPRFCSSQGYPLEPSCTKAQTRNLTVNKHGFVMACHKKKDLGYLF